MDRELNPVQETVLLNKHNTGDVGNHRWETVRSLLRKGYFDQTADNKLFVTAKGKQYCDEYHMLIGLHPRREQDYAAVDRFIAVANKYIAKKQSQR